MEEDGNNEALRFVLEAVHHRLGHGGFEPSLAPAARRAGEQVPGFHCR